MADVKCSGSVHRKNAFANFYGTQRDGLAVVSRRGMLKAGFAGLAGLSLPEVLRTRAQAAQTGQRISGAKSVILLWMTGGPSHIDTWDPKPDRPLQNRGPFGVVRTRLPGTFLCEHLPKQAAMLDKFTIIRSVDARSSNHSPNKVFQTGNPAAEARTNSEAHRYPAIASVVAKLHGANHPSMPPYVACMKSSDHIAFAGYLGKQYDPFIAEQAARLPVYTNVGVDTGESTRGNLFRLPGGLSFERLNNRQRLLQDFDRLRTDLDLSGSMDAINSYQRQAVDMVLGRRAQTAFDLSQEPAAGRDRYGKHLWCQQALLARRLVEAGVAFVTLDLSHHPSSSTWDTHGDNIPPYGGISRGLGPLLPVFDHLISTLVSDLEERGLLDQVLIIAMGEFGARPTWEAKAAPTAATTGPPACRWRWPAGACGTGRSWGRPSETAATSSIGRSRRAIWPQRSIAPWACRSTPRTWITKAGLASSSKTTDNRFTSCFEPLGSEFSNPYSPDFSLPADVRKCQRVAFLPRASAGQFFARTGNPRTKLFMRDSRRVAEAFDARLLGGPPDCSTLRRSEHAGGSQNRRSLDCQSGSHCVCNGAGSRAGCLQRESLRPGC